MTVPPSVNDHLCSGRISRLGTSLGGGGKAGGLSMKHKGVRGAGYTHAMLMRQRNTAVPGCPSVGVPETCTGVGRAAPCRRSPGLLGSGPSMSLWAVVLLAAVTSSAGREELSGSLLRCTGPDTPMGARLRAWNGSYLLAGVEGSAGCGVEAGDRLVAVDGLPLSGLSLQESISLFFRGGGEGVGHFQLPLVAVDDSPVEEEEAHLLGENRSHDTTSGPFSSRGHILRGFLQVKFTPLDRVSTYLFLYTTLVLSQNAPSQPLDVCSWCFWQAGV